MSQPLPESIHPRLKAALGCLDVQLEQELMLYSAQQYSTQLSVSELPPSASQENPEPQYFGHFESEQSVAAPLNFEASSSQASPPDSFVNREADHSMEQLTVPSDLMEPFLFLPTEEAEPLLSPSEAGMESDLSSLFPSMLSDEEEHYQNPPNQKELQELTRPLGNPDNYLASSEALLRNLRKTQPKAERHWLSPLFTPWGMAAGLGVILTLVGINLMFNSGLQQRLRLATQPPHGNSPSQPPTVAEKRPPQQPDLTAQEFQDVNLPNLSRLQPSASPANSSKIQPSNLQPGKIQSGNPQPSKVNASGIRPSGPVPAPSATTIPRLEGAPAGNDNFYFVISNYTGQPSLDQARQGFPSAYVVNFREGARIQFGAFDDLKSAENLVNTLKNRGIAATVRKPRQPG